jgi:hypothetical protein
LFATGPAAWNCSPLRLNIVAGVQRIRFHGQRVAHRYSVDLHLRPWDILYTDSNEAAAAPQLV